MKSEIVRSLIATAMLVGFTVAVPSAQAKQRYNNNCARKVHQAEYNLQRAIQRHGSHSRQAEQRRRQLRKIEARCGGI